jgi:adenine-specific DNA glycosylase
MPLTWQRQRHVELCEFGASLSYIARPCLKNTTKQNVKKTEQSEPDMVACVLILALGQQRQAAPRCSMAPGIINTYRDPGQGEIISKEKKEGGQCLWNDMRCCPLTSTHNNTYMHTHALTHSYMYTHMHMHTYTHTHTHTHAHSHTYIYIHMHTHMHTHTYVHIHTHAHSHIYTPQQVL